MEYGRLLPGSGADADKNGCNPEGAHLLGKNVNAETIPGMSENVWKEGINST